MKTIITATLAALTLSACGERIVYVESTVPPTDPPTTTEAPVETTTTVPPTTTTEPQTRPTVMSNEPANPNNIYDPQGYLDWMALQAADLWWVLGDDPLLEAGLVICEMFDSGMSLREVADTVVAAMINTGTGIYAEDLGVAIAAASVFLCPEYRDWVQDEFNRL